MQSLPFKILIIALAVTLLTPFSAFAQNAVAEKVFLKSGKSYTGEIVLRNDEVLILKLSDGTRFQFAAQDIEKIETVTSEEQQAEQNEKEPEPVLSGIIELSGGVSAAQYKTSAVPFTSAGISFGSDQFGDGTFFIGVGTAIHTAFLSAPDVALNFIPVYLKGRKIFKRSIVSPYIALDLGYAFAAQKDYSGGIYSKINLGIQKRLTYKTSFFTGLYAGVTGYGGSLTEQYENNNFSFNGKTAFVSGGLSLGLQF
jgi:hypothetical protein